MRYQKILLAVLALTLPVSALAKRKPPVSVPPVVWDGVEYRAPLDVEHMGYVQAFELPSRHLLWETKIYDVSIIPLVEEDVQWVFISGMQIQNGKLLVRNEKKESFTLDLKTGSVDVPGQRWMPWLLVPLLLSFPLFAWKLTRPKPAR